MKSVQINKYGGGDVLAINEHIPTPFPDKGKVLVEIYAASINPFDFKLREGFLKNWIPITFPTTLGGDFSGVVKTVGKETSEFKIGDEVFGSALILNGGSGSFSEFAIARVANISYRPSSVTFEEAAALPLVGASAIQALEDNIKLKSGQKICIHGGAGGIGHIAIQIAKLIGAYVATTASSDDMEFVRGLGANEVIDYKKQNFEELLKNYDAVYDLVGGEITNKSFTILKKGGVIVSMVGQPSLERAKKYEVVAIGQSTKTNNIHLDRLAKLVSEEKIKVTIDKVFPLEQIKEAFEHLKKNKPRGKVVLKIKPYY